MCIGVQIMWGNTFEVLNQMDLYMDYFIEEFIMVRPDMAITFDRAMNYNTKGEVVQKSK